MFRDYLSDLDGPTAEDLAEIEREGPLIAAETALADHEIHMLTVHGGPSELDWRRWRRLKARVEREALAYLCRTVARQTGVAA
jgi:hypothetical protein